MTFTISSESVEISTRIKISWCMREVDVLQLSPKGVRFANELGRRDYVTARIQKECAALPDGFQGTVLCDVSEITKKIEHHAVIFFLYYVTRYGNV